MNQKNKKGFGIIEVLIASTIVIAIILAFTAVARATLKGTDDMNERAQAINLAQEGLEMVRQIRDSNWTDSNGNTLWDSLLYDPLAGNWSEVPRDSLKTYALTFDSLLRRYYLTESTAPENILLAGDANVGFKRFVRVSSANGLLPSNDTASKLPDQKDNFAMKVTVEVITPGGKTVSVSELMTNWRPQF